MTTSTSPDKGPPAPKVPPAAPVPVSRHHANRPDWQWANDDAAEQRRDERKGG